jgi:hypothetical protein
MKKQLSKKLGRVYAIGSKKKLVTVIAYSREKDFNCILEKLNEAI